MCLNLLKFGNAKKIKFPKQLLLALILLHAVFSVQAKNYYFSSSTGNDAFTSIQAQNEATPWKSISKLNSIFSSLVAGDSILFKSGDIFYGAINITKSGTSARPIVISAYGIGDKPLITGLITLSSWSSVSGGVYQTVANPAIKNSLNFVTLNGIPKAAGRYPNADEPDGGYLRFETSSGITSITDNQLTSAVNWKGAEVVIRKRHFALEKCKVISQSGGTITYASMESNYPGRSTNPDPTTANPNYGYFFQRDARTLDQLGEWFFNPTTKRLQMYFGAANPLSYIIKVSTLDTLININTQKYINISKIALEGGNFAAIYAGTSGNINIESCDINSSGGKGVFIYNSPNILLDDVTTKDVLCGAIDINSKSYGNITVRNCSLLRTGMLAGMGSFWNDADYKAICINVASGALIEYNSIDSTGFMAIQFNGSDIMIKNNFINYYNIVKDDGGGIYTYQTGTDAEPGPIYTNRVIKENIVMNGMGASGGSGKIDVDGIFLDGRVTDVDVLNNSIANVGVNGIYTNNAINLNIRGNTCFNNACAIGITRYTLGYNKKLDVKQNIFFPKYSTQNDLAFQDNGIYLPEAKTIQENMQQIGLIDSNYFATPNATGFTYYYSPAENAWNFPKPMSFEGWKSYTGHDKKTKLPPKKIQTYKLNNLSGSNLVPNGQFTENLGDLLTSALNGAAVTWDNTNKVSGIGSLKITPPLPASTDFTQIRTSVGGISAAKKYILRFTTLGTTTNGVLNAYLAKTSAVKTILSPAQNDNFGTTKQVHEFLFDAPIADADGSVVIEIQQSSGTTFIDNIVLSEANVTLLDIDDLLRFEYNPTKTVKTITLDGNYIGVDSVLYPGVVVLQPYTSKILIKDTGVVKAALIVTATQSANISCYGGIAPVIVSASGGKAPYTGTGSFNLVAGTYIYIVKDASGLQGADTITITQPSGPLKASVSAGTILVNGGSTTNRVTATGGTAPYTGTGTFTVTAGSYSYTVKDANGCSSVVSVNISQPPPSIGLALSAGVPEISCFGSSTTITVSATGGQAPYIGTGDYSVNAGKGSIKLSVSNPIAASATFLNSVLGPVSSAKNYVLRFSTLGTAPNGSMQVYLRQTSAPWTTLTATQGAFFGTSRVDHQFLFKSSATVTSASFLIEVLQTSGTVYIDNMAFFEATASGTLIGPNLFATGQFEDSATTLTSWSATNNHLLEWDSTSKISSIYYYNVKDNAGTSLVAIVPIQQPSSPLSVQASVTSAITVNGGTGRITLTGKGGVSPYTGTGVFNVKAGTYSYVITDANGCTAAATITISEPPSGLAAVIKANVIKCFNGFTTVNVSATGGKAPYSGVGTFNNITAGSGSLQLSFNTAIVDKFALLYSNIGAVSSSKSYILRFTTLGTTSNGSLRASLRLTNSPWSNITDAQIRSFGTSRVDHELLFSAPTTQTQTSFLIEIMQSSGTVYVDNIAFFEADVNGQIMGNNLYVDGQFENGITNINTYSSNNNHTATWDVTGKINNTYSYMVTDDAGAKSTAFFTVIQPASALKAAATATKITVVGGSATVTVSASGGTAPYSGTGNFSVEAGTYSYIITDANSCISTARITVAPPVASRNSAIKDTSGNGTKTARVPPGSAIETMALDITGYPNPSQTHFSVAVGGGTMEMVNITVQSIDGKILYKTKGASNSKYEFGSKFNPGIYVVKAIQGSVSRIIKLVKTSF